jgi:hypothetical protein
MPLLTPVPQPTLETLGLTALWHALDPATAGTVTVPGTPP